MRKLNYEEYMKTMHENASRFYVVTEGEKTGPRKPGSSKPRAPEEEFVLLLLDYKRWQRALKEGRLKKIGPRRYKFL